MNILFYIFLIVPANCNTLCNNLNDTFINVYDCSSYYICNILTNVTEINMNKQYCPPNTVFSQKNSSCILEKDYIKIYKKKCVSQIPTMGSSCYIINETIPNDTCGTYLKCSNLYLYFLHFCIKNNYFTRFNYTCTNLKCNDT